jgi:protoporphyrinogen oxidase
MSEHAPVVILGGGLTGLSAAYHLGPIPGVVLERATEVGGLCRTHEEDGFSFDCTGHLLHLRDSGIRGLVERLLPDTFARHERRALIFSKGVYTAYPFQANLHGLPQEVVRECLNGFVESLVQRESRGEPDFSRWSFRQWAEATFGAGIAKHFMIPYNSKLWRIDLDEIECGWVSWSIPRPTLDEVLQGALGSTVRGLGYNPTFLYPRQGGIRVLPEAFAARCSDIRTGSTVLSIDVGQRTVTLTDGTTIGYEALISTLPLDRFIAAATGLPDDLPPAGRKLRAVRVLNISLGIDRPSPSRAHWIYFPEPEFSFYRAGFPGNLSPSVVPRGCASLYVERSLGPGETFDADEEVARAIEGLKRAGIIWNGDRIVYRRVSVLDPAYVIYDRFRARHVPGLIERLREFDVHSAGRFGAWEYSSMEDAIRAGADAAHRVRAQLTRRYPMLREAR